MSFVKVRLNLCTALKKSVFLGDVFGGAANFRESSTREWNCENSVMPGS